MKILLLVSAGGEAFREKLGELVATVARANEVRVLAPEAEAKLLRPLGVPVESWRPSGLFSMLRSVGALRRAVERGEPDLIHAVGWTAAAVALGSLAPARAATMIVTLPEPIRANEIPRPFLEKRLPELLQRAARFSVPDEALARTLTEEFGVDPDRVQITSNSQTIARNEG